MGGVRIERSDYVPCRVADWRVVFKEPEDLQAGPGIPENAVWKLTPSDPNEPCCTTDCVFLPSQGYAGLCQQLVICDRLDELLEFIA